MIQLSVKDDIAQALAKVAAVEPRQFAFIAATAINKTAQQVQRELNEETKRAYDRPTPLTQKAFIIPARFGGFADYKTGRLEAIVKLRDEAAKGTPPAKYMNPSIYGGARRHKRFERALIANGIMPANMFAVIAPRSPVPRDRFGNVPAGYIVKMLSALKALSEVGFTANRTERSARRRRARQLNFFFISPDNPEHVARNLPFGIYQRIGQESFRMVLAFVKQPTYGKRYNFEGVSTRTAAKYFPIHLRAAIERAVATSRSSGFTGKDIAALLR